MDRHPLDLPDLPAPTKAHLVSLGYVLDQEAGVLHVTVPDGVSRQEVLDAIAAFDPLPALKADAVARVDRAAGAARARYITTTPGQEAVYALKREQAAAYQAAGYPADTTGYPLIAAESAATGVTPTQAADTILATAAQWIALAAAIEQLRQGAKAAIAVDVDAVTVAAEADDAVTQLDAI